MDSTFFLALAAFVSRFGPFTTVNYVVQDSDQNHQLFNKTKELLGLPTAVTWVTPGQGVVEDDRDFVVCIDNCSVGTRGTWLVPEGIIEPKTLAFDSNVFSYGFKDDGSIIFLELYGLKKKMGFRNTVGYWNASTSTFCKFVLI